MKFQLQYGLKVSDSKYREFLNVLERNMKKQKPLHCSKRMAFQSIIDMHVFEYKEIWTDIKSLNEYMNSMEFKSLRGAFQLLTHVDSFSVESLNSEITSQQPTVE